MTSITKKKEVEEEEIEEELAIAEPRHHKMKVQLWENVSFEYEGEESFDRLISVVIGLTKSIGSVMVQDGHVHIHDDEEEQEDEESESGPGNYMMHG